MRTNKLLSILAVLLMALTAQAQSAVVTWENTGNMKLALSDGQLAGKTNYSQGDVTLSSGGTDETPASASIPTHVLEWENLSETRLTTYFNEPSIKTNCSQGGVSIGGWRGQNGKADIFVFDDMLCLNACHGAVYFESSSEKILKIEIVCAKYTPNGFTNNEWNWDANTKTLTWTGESDKVDLVSTGSDAALMVDDITALTITLTHTVHTYGEAGTSRYTCSECGHVDKEKMITFCDVNGDGVLDSSDITDLVDAIMKQ